MHDRFVSKFLLVALTALVLAACAGSEVRVASTPDEPTVRMKSRYSSLEVIKIALPVYAASEEIFVQDASGAINALGPLWADDPSRAITLQLSSDLAAITGARVAPEPWPFRGIADAKVDVRVKEMHATASQSFTMSGQYFVAPDTSGPDRSREFSISIPLPPGASASQIATARSQATSSLAEDIVKRGLR